MSFTGKVKFVERGEGDEEKKEGIPGGGKVREKILQGRSSEVRKNVKAQVMGGPCEDFGFYAEENGKPLKGNKQSHDMI